MKDNAEELWNRAQTLKVRLDISCSAVQNPGVKFSQQDLDQFAEDGKRLLSLIEIWMGDVYEYMEKNRE